MKSIAAAGKILQRKWKLLVHTIYIIIHFIMLTLSQLLILEFIELMVPSGGKLKSFL